MLPKLSLMQWLVILGFLGFYGFAVFALTRDYFLRHPPAPPEVVSESVSGSRALALGNRLRTSLQAQSGTDPSVAFGDDPLALGREADQLFAQGRYDEAVPRYEQVLRLTPADAETYNDLGFALHYSGRSEEGIAILEIGVETSPDFQRTWLSLGFVSSQVGRFDRAREALQRARSLDPTNPVGAEAARLLKIIESG